MLQLQVEDIKWEAPDTATYFLRDVADKKIIYKAGQFLTLVFNHHNEELRRSYSISSSPDEGRLAITIKRVPNGELSRFLLTHAKIGDIWQAVEPAGRFIVSNFEQAKDIFFFAAGSGITPILSQIKYVLNREGKSKLHLIYSSRSAGNILFKASLDILQQQHHERLNIVHLLSNDARRLNNVMAEQLVRQQARFDLQQAQFYLCGPFDYMRMIRLTLIYMGLPADNIRKENFVLETVTVSNARTSFAPHKVRIVFGDETHDIMAGENQSILQAALQNKIGLPYSCRAGICSTCTAKCKSGKVVMTVNEVLTDADLADGLVLTCTGYAVTDDVVIEF
ncbi:ferredoxin--NADP reductase [Mucilaginibacter boryungensis]|uniref:Ferredoxin--NADP reductase n=1 Tax=Mucilaginibacter boryungensis TaxID=768480 RepID=A0ABR9XDE1_9SPHI|nr:ferredoxin--NADP reductase [Mucilaginibacter boryungensis]MBE9664999.1 ferredoxin--NADP reductase [Mucilaginibacter boryungensis]